MAVTPELLLWNACYEEGGKWVPGAALVGSAGATG